MGVASASSKREPEGGCTVKPVLDAGLGGSCGSSASPSSPLEPAPGGTGSPEPSQPREATPPGRLQQSPQSPPARVSVSSSSSPGGSASGDRGRKQRQASSGIGGGHNSAALPGGSLIGSPTCPPGGNGQMVATGTSCSSTSPVKSSPPGALPKHAGEPEIGPQLEGDAVSVEDIDLDCRRASGASAEGDAPDQPAAPCATSVGPGCSAVIAAAFSLFPAASSGSAPGAPQQAARAASSAASASRRSSSSGKARSVSPLQTSPAGSLH